MTQTTTAEAVAAHPRPTLSNRLVLLMAVATGTIVANLYYAQPILHQIASTFSVGAAAAALVITLGQAGYAAGLVLVVPLGDLHPRRRLVSRIYLAAAAALVLCAAAPTLWVFILGAAAAGAASVAGQIMIPFAADLAEPARRGRTIARIMTGLLLGILLARTVSGVVAQLAGWRSIFWISAGLMVVFSFTLARLLPDEPERPHMAYRQLVPSAFALLAQEPALRRRAWHGGCAFAAFSVLWTSVAFLLSGAPYHYSNAVIGLFGLAGVAGVGAANLAGRVADAHRTAIATAVAGMAIAGSFALMLGGKTSVWLLLAGIVVLDAGTQGMQITNQAVIYALRPESRSRINSAYMFCYFTGGSIGSISAGFVWANWGWDGVSGLGAAFGLLTLAMSGFDRLRPPGVASVAAPPG